MKNSAAPNIPKRFLTSEDEELLNRELSLYSLDELQNIISEPHKSSEIPEIEHQYNVTPPGGRNAGHSPHLECAFTHSARHWLGYVMRYSNGDRIRIGRTCGKLHFGLKFKTVENSFKALNARQAHLHKLLNLISLLPEVIKELHEMKLDKSIQSYDSYRRKFTDEFANLAERIGVITQTNNGKLIALDRKRDKEKEYELAEKKAPKLIQEIDNAQNKSPKAKIKANKALNRWRDKNKVYVNQELDFGICQGYETFLGPRILTPKIIRITEELTLIRKELLTSTSSDWNKSNINTLTQKIRGVLAEVHSITEQIANLQKFTSTENIKRIARWSEQEIKFSTPSLPYFLIVEDNKLVRSDNGSELSLSHTLTQPKIKKLTSLAKLIGEAKLLR